MPINSPGTLAFAPRGFEFQRSLSSTNPMINGVETFTWDPRFHGFAGDLAVSCLMITIGNAPTTPNTITNGFSSWVYTPAVTTPGANQPARNCVFPAPLIKADPAVNGQTIALGGFPNCIQSLGVIVGFRYCPANGNGIDQISTPTFNNQTAVYPNTPVEVDVLTDPHAIYRAQVYAPWGYSSVLTDDAYMFIGGVNTYQVTVNGTTPLTTTAAPVAITFTFPLGEFSGSAPGSRAYVWTPFTMVQGATTNTFLAIDSSADMLAINNLAQGPNMTRGLTGQAETIFGSQTVIRSIGLTKGIDGNRHTLATGTVYPNVMVDVSVINHGFSRTPFYFPTAQVPTS